MPSFHEGCLVLFRSTGLLYTVVRWDEETALLQLAPAASRTNHREDSSNADNNNPPGVTSQRPRLAFEHMVDLVDESASEPSPETKSTSVGDPAPYARRSANLDARVEIRFDPKRGRGLFALRDIPAGTEVMRVPAAAAVLLDRSKSSCGGCLLPTDTVGSLKKCHGFPLSFCAGCIKAGTVGGVSGVHSSATRELTKELNTICATSSGVDKDSLRLAADVFVRRKAGLLDDSEWGFLNSLESHDNEAHTMSLAPAELQKCTRLFKTLVDINISDEEVQAMYRRQAAVFGATTRQKCRITRNAHTVSPNTSKPGFGSVQGLFPCGALVNHSCLPNTFFHCVAEPSSPEGRPVVKQVLRSICNIRAGDELCCSYLSSGAAVGTVSERRDLLMGWGFRCACARCQSEAEEEKRLRRQRTPIDERTLKMLERLAQISCLGQKENAPALREEAYMPDLQLIAEFYSREKGKRLSPMLQYRVAVLMMEVTALISATNLFFRFMVCGFAADELFELRNAMAITCRQQQHMFATKVEVCDLGETQATNKLEGIRAVGKFAREDARQLHELYYGGQSK
ncbi:unnamed protein product [Ectocarpus fasciculatus]